MDPQLRDLLQTAVGDPPRRVTIEAVRRGVARRRRTEWATGTAAVVLLAGLGIVLPGHLFAPRGSTGGVSSSAATGAPRYYVQTIINQQPPGVTVVRATATGKVTDTVRCPWPKSQIVDEGVAPADGSTFFLACQRSRRAGPQFVVTGTRIYQFQLTGLGRIQGYSLVPGGNLGPVSTFRMAATPDGTQLAIPITQGKAPPSVLVLNTRTGAHAVWRNIPGTAQFGPGDLSWARHGRELAFRVTVTCPPGGAGQCVSGQQWRVLRHPASGGQLASSKLLVLKSQFTGHALGYINDSMITPDGSALIVVALHSPRGPSTPGNIDVVKVDPATGHPIRVLLHLNTGNGVSYEFFSSDPSGRFMILDAGPPQGANPNGWIDHGRLALLTPANGRNVVYEAW